MGTSSGRKRVSSQKKTLVFSMLSTVLVRSPTFYATNLDTAPLLESASSVKKLFGVVGQRSSRGTGRNKTLAYLSGKSQGQNTSAPFKIIIVSIAPNSQKRDFIAPSRFQAVQFSPKRYKFMESKL